jgi:TPR repeat protein
MTMHSCIYLYWGWYWPEVYHHIPLYLAQIAFLYLFDMLLCWSRRDEWTLGFGPIPIVLSTNLFLTFKDDWFWLQFLMIAVGALAKEFIKWERAGHRVHIFNPSAFSLSLFSAGLLLTRTTAISWGQEIAITLHYPPYIYLEIFLIGLVVQGLFSVTLVTLSAAVVLGALNVAFTAYTGLYHFVDSNIPIAVFLGLHLLVTDPATSPRRSSAKLIFGGLYGAAVFGMYALLGWFGAPQFYDKLLCVPVLNLSVRALDRLGARIEQSPAAITRRLSFLEKFFEAGPRRANFAYMSVWAALFAVMFATGFVGNSHPGANPAFWERACGQGKGYACRTWMRILNVNCRQESAQSCIVLGRALNGSPLVARDGLEAAKSFGRACDLGSAEGCSLLASLAHADEGAILQRGCDRGDSVSCFMLGSLLHQGNGLPANPERAVTLFDSSCKKGFARGCSRLGESYLWGEGTGSNPARALASFDVACRGQFGPACANAAAMYRRGLSVPPDKALARKRLEQACELGVKPACNPVDR